MKKNLLLVATIAMTLFSACSNDNEGPDLAGRGLTVTGTVGETITRVNGTSWETADAIGVSGGSYSNVKYTIVDASAGTFNGETITADEGTTFTAYYPYAETIENGAINFSVVNEADNTLKALKDIDYLFASATSQNNALAFKFAHKMSKLNLTFKIKEGSGITAENLSYELKGVAVSGSFNTADGTVTPNTQTGSIKVSNVSFNSASEVILPPQNLSENIEIAITVGTDTYVGTFKPALATSYEYAYEITLSLGESTPSVSISLKSESIKNWEAGTGGNFDAIKQNVLEVGDFIMADGSILDKGTTLDDTQKNNVRGVVFYLGDTHPSVLYNGTTGYETTNDILLSQYSNCSKGLAISLPQTTGAFSATELDDNSGADGADAYGLMTNWYMNDSQLSAIYPSRYAWDETNNLVVTTATAYSECNNFLGYNNTYLWNQYAIAKNVTINALTLLSTFAQSNTLPTYASSWYIPSQGELLSLFVENNTAIQADVLASLAQWGGTTTEKTLTGTYWTSTEARFNSNTAQTMTVGFYSGGSVSKSNSGKANTSTGYKYLYTFAFGEPTKTN